MASEAVETWPQFFGREALQQPGEYHRDFAERLTDKKLSIPRSLQNRLLRECPKIMSEAHITSTTEPPTDAPYTGFNGQRFR